MLSFSQCEYCLHITVQLSIWQCLHWIFTVTYSIVYNYSSQYTNCAVYICFPFHNVIFFHNHCPINSTTMFTAYPQHIPTVLFTITLTSILTLLFIYAFLFIIWYFFTITAQLTLQQCLQHILNIYIQYCLQLLSPVYLLCCLHMLSFSQCEYFLHITVQLSIWQCLHWIFTVTYSIVYNYSSQYTNCAVYICFPFHNVIFFHNHCPINSTTMFTAYPQHIPTILFTITLTSILTLLFILLSFS